MTESLHRIGAIINADVRIRFRRLSTLAGFGLLVVAATGAFRAVIEVQTWANLLSTAFGVFVLLKIGLILVVAALGALNRYGHLPRLPRRNDSARSNPVDRCRIGRRMRIASL